MLFSPPLPSVLFFHPFSAFFPLHSSPCAFFTSLPRVSSPTLWFSSSPFVFFFSPLWFFSSPLCGLSLLLFSFCFPSPSQFVSPPPLPYCFFSHFCFTLPFCSPSSPFWFPPLLLVPTPSPPPFCFLSLHLSPLSTWLPPPLPTLLVSLFLLVF